jgi:protein involved in polysaccharide export with SLBB domain
MRIERVLCAVALLALGCGGRAPREGQQAILEVTRTPEGADVAERLRSHQEYALKAGDRVAVQVLTDPTLNSITEIQPDGWASIPWAGMIQAQGRPLLGLRQEIEDSLGKYLRHPIVTMSIEAFGPSRVYVTGEVRVPGAYRIEAGQTVVGAIAAAGGLLTTANTQDVLLMRRVSETEASVFRINIQRVLKGAKEFGDPLVQHQDIVHVPRTLIADINLFVQQFFEGIRPLFAFYLDGWEAFNIDQVRIVRAEQIVR